MKILSSEPKISYEEGENNNKLTKFFKKEEEQEKDGRAGHKNHHVR